MGTSGNAPFAGIRSMTWTGSRSYRRNLVQKMSLHKPAQAGRTLRLRLSAEERGRFVKTARCVDVPHSMLLRHLIRYVLRENISWPNLLSEFKELPADMAVQVKEAEAAKADNKARKATLSIQLTPELYSGFGQFAERWGTTPGIILRRLISLYSNGRIERHSVLGQ